MAKGKGDKGGYEKFDLPDDGAKTTVADPEAAARALEEIKKTQRPGAAPVEDVVKATAVVAADAEAQKQLDQEVEAAKAHEENVNRLASNLACTMLTGKEFPYRQFKEGTPQVINDTYRLLIDLQIGGIIKGYDVLAARRVHQLLVTIESEYGG